MPLLPDLKDHCSILCKDGQITVQAFPSWREFYIDVVFASTNHHSIGSAAAAADLLAAGVNVCVNVCVCVCL